VPQLHRNKYVYDLHLQYIALLQQTGIYQRVRAARDSMATLFPLTEGRPIQSSSLALLSPPVSHSLLPTSGLQRCG
jgi:hypothetical protein